MLPQIFQHSTRAYVSGQSEFVTRSDRRGRELEARKAVPVARLPAHIKRRDAASFIRKKLNPRW
jgi:hypothetical protein